MCLYYAFQLKNSIELILLLIFLARFNGGPIVIENK